MTLRVCFFSNTALEQLRKEQYSINDINILKELGFEVIISNSIKSIPLSCDLYFSWWASGSIYPLIVALLCNKPIIVVAGGNEAIPYRDSKTNDPHGYLANGWLKQAITRFTLRYCTAVIAVSNFMIEGLRSLGCNQPIVIHNCVNTDLFSSNTYTKREYIVTSFRLDELPTLIKRGENFIRAASIVIKSFPNSKFMIVGHKGNSFQRLNKLVDELGISNSITFSGSIENSDVVRVLQKAICFVQPSDTETFGVAVAEAMSVECPVVISSRGALLELAGDNAVYVDQNSVESIASGIIKIISMDDKERKILGIKSRLHIEGNFSYNKRKGLIYNLISNIV